MKRYLLILFLFASAVLSAQTTTSAGFGLDPSDEQAVAEMKARMDRIRKHRPTLALVLSGGGAKGAATVGALKYLEQYKFPVDMVVGTSIGGLIGGVYAMGYTPDFLDSLMRNIDWDRTMSDRVDWEYIPYGTSPQAAMETFRDRLTRGGITATIRASRGEDIFAACGLLAGQHNHA